MAKFKLPTELKEILADMFDDMTAKEENKMKRAAKDFMIRRIGESPKLMFVLIERFVELLIEDILRDPAAYEMKQKKHLCDWSKMARDYKSEEE